jgi:hypothetical protein
MSLTERQLAAGALEHELATASGDAAYLIAAFEHTEAALAGDPSSVPTLFNRALIASDLGLCHVAASTWRQYLLLEQVPEWRDEANARLSGRPCQDDFKAGPSTDSLISIAIGTVLPRWLEEHQQHLPSAPGYLAQLEDLGEKLYLRAGDPTVRLLASEIKSAQDPEHLAAIDACVRGRLLLDEERRRAEARRELLRAEPPLRRRQSSLVPWVHLWLARIDLLEGRLESAESRLARLAALPEVTRSPYLKGRVLWASGLAAARSGSFHTAYNRITQAEEEFRRGGSSVTAASMQALRAETLTNLGFEREAWTPRILSLRALQAFPGRYLHLHNNLVAGGRTARRSGFHSTADAFLVEAAEVGRWSPANTVIEIEAALAVAHDLAERGVRARASERYRKALVTIRSMEPGPDRERLERMALLGLWSDPSYSGPHEGPFLATLDFFGASGPLYLRLEALRTKAARERRDRDHDAARRTVEDAVELVRQAQTTITSDEFGLRHLESVQDIFDDAIDAAVRENKPLRALELLEAARRSTAAHPDQDTGLSLTNAQSHGTEEQGRPVIVVYGMTRHTFVWWRLDGARMRWGWRDASSVESLVKAVLKTAPAGEVEPAALAGLYGALLGDALEGLPRDRPLIIVSDGILQRVPFAALREHKTDAPLIRQRRVSFRTGLKTARETTASGSRDLQRKDWRVVSVGDPAFDQDRLPFARLPGAASEAGQVAAAYGDQAHLLTGQAATAGMVRQVLISAEVLHLASHASAGDGPGDGSFLLAASFGSTGLASVEDILPTDSELRLVVLSGCTTLGVKPSRSGGLIGLASAFSARGVTATLGTLWDIDDRVLPRLMADFHRFFLEGHSAAESLRRAQLAHLARSPQSCCDWAALQLIGDVPPEHGKAHELQ